MPFPYEPLGEGTDEDLLKLTRSSMAQVIATGKSYQVSGPGGGRMLTREDLPELRATIVWLEQRIASASGTSGRTTENAVKFNRR